MTYEKFAHPGPNSDIQSGATAYLQPIHHFHDSRLTYPKRPSAIQPLSYTCRPPRSPPSTCITAIEISLRESRSYLCSSGAKVAKTEQALVLSPTPRQHIILLLTPYHCPSIAVASDLHRRAAASEHCRRHGCPYHYDALIAIDPTRCPLGLPSPPFGPQSGSTAFLR